MLALGSVAAFTGAVALDVLALRVWPPPSGVGDGDVRGGSAGGASFGAAAAVDDAGGRPLRKSARAAAATAVAVDAAADESGRSSSSSKSEPSDRRSSFELSESDLASSGAPDGAIAGAGLDLG